MKLTKYEHACLVIEDNGQKLVIDPGVYSKSLPELKGVVGIIITHVHADHFDPRRVETLVKNNPDVLILTTEEVSKELTSSNYKIVTNGSTAKVGLFTLDFYGELHAHVHDVWPQAQNVGVMVNNYFYYPGDSFTKPVKQPKLVALPIGGPWLKTGEVMDYLADLKSPTVFPTHTIHISQIGIDSAHQWLAEYAKEKRIEYIDIGVGETLDF